MEAGQDLLELFLKSCCQGDFTRGTQPNNQTAINGAMESNNDIHHREHGDSAERQREESCFSDVSAGDKTGVSVGRFSKSQGLYRARVDLLHAPTTDGFPDTWETTKPCCFFFFFFFIDGANKQLIPRREAC